ncbi:MAG TPA: DUF4340 domain-containing protein [Rhodanobacteraceae bacterium]|nr:DUF4340 domain-containing protein [Rhodanobacteraceae bacterium]
MNQKTLIGLAAAALVAIVVAVAINRSNAPRSEGGGEETRYLAPELRDHVNDVDKLVVTGAENKTIATISRGPGGWTIAEKGGYAADTGKLREFLLKLADATLVEQKTANKDKYAALGVEDVASKDAKDLEIEIGGLKQPIKIIVGNANPRGGTFVRRAGEAESWLASGSINVEKMAEDWLRKDLVDIAANRVQSVAITHADGKSVRVAKAADGDASFKIADVPKGREPGSEYAANGLGSTLSGLRFDDVIAAKDAAPGDKPIKVHYAMFDGLVVDVTAWEKDGKDYAEFTASLDAAQADQHIAAQQAKAKADYEAAVEASKKSTTDDKSADAAKSTAEPPKPAAVADPAKDHDEKRAALDKEVADLNARFKGWTYVIPSYKYANMNKSIDDLLKPLDDKKAEPAKKPAAKPAKKAG